MEKYLTNTDRGGQTTDAPTNGVNTSLSIPSFRRVSPMKVAQLKRVRDGAEQRMLRLSTELTECRAIIRRKYTEVFDAKGVVIGRNLLNSEQVLGCKLKRTQIEKDLAVAKGDFLKARRNYRAAVTNNFQIERKSVRLIREENRIQRESKKLLKETKKTLKEHGSNGGTKEMQLLTSLAVADDVKGFRTAFDETVGRFDQSLYTTISGVSSVKTDIIHEVMEELAEEARKNQITSLTDSVDDKNQ